MNRNKILGLIILSFVVQGIFIYLNSKLGILNMEQLFSISLIISEVIIFIQVVNSNDDEDNINLLIMPLVSIIVFCFFIITHIIKATDYVMPVQNVKISVLDNGYKIALVNDKYRVDIKKIPTKFNKDMNYYIVGIVFNGTLIKTDLKVIGKYKNPKIIYSVKEK